jgi:cell division protein FtsB
MRDIGSRIGRYRLTRYARPSHRRPPWLGWLLAALALWLVWATAVSDHSLFRIWSLRRERAATEKALADAQREQARLDAEAGGPQAKRLMAERRLREESGMAKPGEIVYRIRGDAADSARTR